MFQFLIGSLVTNKHANILIVSPGFQFLIGSLVTPKLFLYCSISLMFQFLIGSLVTAKYPYLKFQMQHCFNSS